MKQLAILAAAATIFAMPAAAHDIRHGHGHGHGHVHGHGHTVTTTYRGGGTILVACWRGPLEEIIWDHPLPKFIDSLVAIGYDFPTAHAIGERICRDKSLVNNPGALSAAMRQVYAASPAGR